MNKPHVSKREWEEEIRPALAGKGFDQRQREKIESLLWASLDRDIGDDTAGIIEEEIGELVEYMRKHMDEHRIPESKIVILEEQLRKYLKV